MNEVSFDVEQGSIVGLIGPNGAGKTTVFNLITGNYVPDGGDIRFAGQSIKGMKPHTIVSLGIARRSSPSACSPAAAGGNVLQAATAGCTADHRFHVPHPAQRLRSGPPLSGP